MAHPDTPRARTLAHSALIAELGSAVEQLHEQSAVATAWIDLEDRIVYANPALLALWGIERFHRVPGQLTTEQLWLDPGAARAATKEARHKGLYQGKLMARRADGSDLPVRITAQLVRGRRGEPVAVLANVIELRAEVAAQEAFPGSVHPQDRTPLAQAFEARLQAERADGIERRHVPPPGPGDVELRRFRQLAADAPVEIWVLDEAGRIEYVNAAAAASLGYEARQLVGSRLAEVDAGFGSAGGRIDPEPASSLPGRPSQPFHVMHRAADGRLVPKEVICSRHMFEGRVQVVAFARDITTLLDAQTELGAREAQLREVLDTYPGWVSCVDEAMRYVYVNRQFCVLVNRPMGEIVGRTPDEVLGPEESDGRREAHRRLLAGDTGFDGARRVFLDWQGRRRTAWVRYRTVDRGPDGGRLFYAFGADITELDDMRQRLSTVTQGLGVGVWEGRYPDGDFDCNDELLVLLGQPRDVISGGSVRALLRCVHAQDRARRRRHFEALSSTDGMPAPIQVRVCRESGEVLWVQEQLRVLSYGADGRPLRLIGVVQDISSLKAREAELQALNAELEQRIERRTRALALAKDEAERANSAKSDFLSHMSHDLRTPLNAIFGFAQLLEMSALTGQDAESVREILRAGRHLVELIDDILDLAAVESGRVTLRPETVGLAELIGECCRMQAESARAGGVAIEAPDVPGHAAVWADRIRLRQVLQNLLSNAIKYNVRKEGRVRIAASPATGPIGGWTVRVVDTGAGLDSDQMRRLFQPFDRLGAERTQVKGTGIGLTISRRLVELMGGHIGVLSAPGSGSEFRVSLPAAAAVHGVALGAPARPPATKVQPAQRPCCRRRVLYVEDNEPNQLLMQRLLGRRDDLDLRVASTSADALALIESFDPQLLLIDIALSDGSGHDLLKELRARGCRTAAVAVSANAMAEDLARGRESGFAAYVTKPLELWRLMQVVDEAFGAAAIS